MITILIVLVCLVLNALLSCAEMAFVTIDKRLLRKEVLGGNKKAIDLEEMQESPERILSVVQIGITLVGAASAAVSGAGAEESIAPWLQELFNLQEHYAETLSIVIVVVPLTILSVVIGELVPKSFAIRYSFKICMIFSPALKLAEKVLGFLVNPMEKVTNSIVEFFLPEEKESSTEEIETELSLNGLKSDHREYIHNLVDLDAKSAKTAMVTWDKVEVLSSIASPNEVYEFVLNKGHTRFPVIDSGEVYGFLHLKEFLQLQHAGEGDNWLSFVRPPTFIRPDMKLLAALKLMKKSKVQFLIIGTASEPIGILTLQDVIEEVVGDIDDAIEDKRIVGFLRHRVIKKR